jgi:hypothetical protein
VASRLGSLSPQASDDWCHDGLKEKTDVHIFYTVDEYGSGRRRKVQDRKETAGQARQDKAQEF